MVDFSGLFKKNSAAAALPPSGGLRPPLEDFFPVATHYDPHTLITKNGELLQIIKLSPPKDTSKLAADANMRDALRIALYKEFHNDDYSIAVHSIRRKERVNLSKRYANPFTKMVNDTWHKLHPLHEHYINEVYVTIIKEGSGDKLFNPALFARSLFGKIEVAARHTDLEIAATELQLAVDNIIESMKPYQAEKLGVYQKKGTQYSAPLNLLSKLIHLKDVEIPIDFTSFDVQLTANTIKFGSDALEIVTPANEKRFGAVLSIKEYRELSVEGIEEIAQIPAEFILAEAADFIPAKKALRHSLDRQKFFAISKDNLVRRTSGLNDMLESNHNSPADFAQHQNVILVLADDLKELNDKIATVIQTFSFMGIMLMREDLRLEDCFWSIQPANFAFHKRLNPINAVRLGGFAQEMGHLPARQEASLAPTTIFKTRDGIPIFFLLPEGENNLFPILGGTLKENLYATHFIISQAMHQETRVVYLDLRGHAEVFIRALEGEYHHLSPQSTPFPLNPLQRPLTDEYRAFLLMWVEGLVCGASGLSLSGQHDDHILAAIAEIYTLPEAQRTLRTLRENLLQKDDFLGKRLTPWVEGNSHSALFDHEADNLPMDAAVTAFNLAGITDDKHSIASMVFYLLQRAAEARKENERLIIVINDMNMLFANPLFGQRMTLVMERLARHNISIIAASSDDVNLISHTPPDVLKDADALLLLRTKPATREFYEAAGILATEIQHSQLLEQGDALLHYEDYDYRVPLLLHRMQTLKPVFFASAAQIKDARALISEKGDSLQQWLPAYMETTQHGKP